MLEATVETTVVSTAMATVDGDGSRYGDGDDGRSSGKGGRKATTGDVEPSCTLTECAGRLRGRCGCGQWLAAGCKDSSGGGSSDGSGGDGGDGSGYGDGDDGRSSGKGGRK